MTIKVANRARMGAFFKGQEPRLRRTLRVENLITGFFGKQIVYVGGIPMHASIPIMRFLQNQRFNCGRSFDGWISKQRLFVGILPYKEL
jgi:hypothetical protein